MQGASGATAEVAGSCAGNGAETVYSFTVPAAGVWTFTTFGENTAFDTALHLRGVCDDAETELACNDDISQGILQSGLIVEALEADAELFIFVDAFAGAGGDFELTLLRADEDAAPTLAAVTANRDENLGSLRLTGGDANGDVIGVNIDFLVEGELMDGSDNFAVDLADPVYGQAAFEGAGLRIQIPPEFADADAIRVNLRDSQGGVSEPIDAALDAQPEVAEGDACDPDVIDNRCAEGNVCPPVDAPVCVAASAPELTEVVAYRDGEALIVHFEGTDATLDTFGIDLQVLDGEGNPMDVGGAAFLQLVAPIFGEAEFAGVGIAVVDGIFGAEGLALPEGAAQVRVIAIDASELESEPVVADIVDLPEVADGEACDEIGLANRCAEGSNCQLVNGAAVCVGLNAPEIDMAFVTHNAATRGVGVAIQGADVEGDVTGFTIQFFDGDPEDGGAVVPPDSDPQALNFAAVDAADGMFQGGAIFELPEEFGAFTHARLTALDAFGLESAPTFVEIGAPEVAGDGEECDPLGAIAACDEGFVCRGEGGTCAAPACGDGALDEGEDCDDGNLDIGDGCDDACAVELVNVGDGGDFAGAVPPGGANIFELELENATIVRAFTHDGLGACPADTDTLLTLQWLNPETGEYEQVGRFDDAQANGLGLCSYFQETLEAGAYRIEVTGFGGGAVPEYTLTVLFVAQVEVGDACDDDHLCPEAAYCPEAVEGEDPPVCTAEVCGDGRLFGDETCDDGNVENGDGCDENCIIEPGCGNGHLEGEEQCDDGNLDNGDGCSDACLPEFEAIDPAAQAIDSDGFPEAANQAWRFTADGYATVRAFTHDGTGEACPADTDTIIDVRLIPAEGDPEGVARNDDQPDPGGGFGGGPLSPCSDVSFGVTPGVTYEIAVTGFGAAAVGAYTLTLEFTEAAGPDAACARSGNADDGLVCGAGLGCAFGAEDGVGICLPPPAAPEPNGAEAEPNQTGADATALNIGDVLTGALDEPGDDADLWDVYVVNIEADGWFSVQTGGVDGCAGDTRLYRIDAAILDADGVDAATNGDNRLAFNDDGGEGLCSRLVEFLPAGDHYFLVDEFGRNAAIEYTIGADPVAMAGAGERCDALGVANRCAPDHACTDDNEDNDGICVQLEE